MLTKEQSPKQGNFHMDTQGFGWSTVGTAAAAAALLLL
jgi:hypothetical protein